VLPVERVQDRSSLLRQVEKLDRLKVRLLGVLERKDDALAVHALKTCAHEEALAIVHDKDAGTRTDIGQVQHLRKRVDTQVPIFFLKK